METGVTSHYQADGSLVEKVAEGLRRAGLEPGKTRPADLESIDEFHFRGREATLELVQAMRLAPSCEVLDIGSGLGGVSRTIAEVAGCQVVGLDLTPELCEVATVLSDWVSYSDRTRFQQGDATNLSFDDNRFDAAVTVHVAMNIEHKHKMYAEARRVLKSGGIFAVFDILQGEGGHMLYPAPWASDASMSHLVTPDDMRALLEEAGFRILHERDSTTESFHWLEARANKAGPANPLPVTTALLFGGQSRDMTKNQLRGLKERRMLTYSFVCAA
ncbi:methyltransferase domain-containing protein [Primorskyibacter aestuariivivens]|uniref:class I SAM-dependent methyltransferase n=1 Tax=Primorskyibacter aestuariivivens TaxID=1888912 RepID=UPI00230005C4|nr:methyltransferase domain-containing protein [Primorskyibacter aestuariivivens]MDA7430513.1 methyltransferase domain-containing protein [Primorskyibacter aestuariivivens]